MSAIALVAAALASGILVGLIRRYALKAALLDHPNERSLHTLPTPRGGGAAIVLVVMACYGVIASLGIGDGEFIRAVLPSSLLIAIISWLDDRGHVNAGVRFAIHLAAAAWAVYALGGMPSLRIGESRIALGVVGSVIAVIAIVAATNFFNFMDGSDGIAGTEALFAGVFGALLLSGSPVWVIPATIAAGALGFLVWNWQPAKIFMGDVGASFLGFTFACLALYSEHVAAPALCWTMVLAIFVVDPLVTVLRRMVRGERWLAAHRSHAYQRLIQSGWSHARVAIAVGLLDVLLGCAAIVAMQQPRFLGAAFIVSIGLLGALYLSIERRQPM